MSEKYRGLSPAEFFHRNKEIAGFSNPSRALYQTVRELVENSLDATETHGILPYIDVEVRLHEDRPEWVTLRVADNGIGIPAHEIPNVFGRVFYGSKYVVRQTRGVFGLGVKMAVLYAQMTTGKPIYVKSSTRDSDVVGEYLLYIDISRNIPHVQKMRIKKKNKNWHGTIVRLTLEGAWLQSKKRIEDYIRRTALISPYATIRYRSPDGELLFERVSKELPEPPQIGKYHPKGVDIEILKDLIRRSNNNDMTLAGFLEKYFEGVGEKIAQEFLTWAGFQPDTKVKELKLADLEKLATAMKNFPKWRRPRPLTLSPLGPELLKKGVKSILKPEFATAVIRPPSSYGGHAFIVEAAIAYGGEIPPQDNVLLLRFANKMPLLYDEGVDVSRKIVDSIDWSIYKIKFPAPVAVVTHVCSTKIPFKGVGKEAIADVPELEHELEIAIRDVARRLRIYLSKLEKMYEVKRKEVTIRKYMGEVSSSLAYVLNMDPNSISSLLEELLKKELEKKEVTVNA
ncbi:MAG: DNA topoisomerase VI subunit B [Thermofilum sp.]|jgi:DNA topoisomerase-6 subunit B|uniref:Type 2 DNA topoisomerase 6 subunit B n=1 Tax=Thermofilum adornatum TaxID=1365176 RepID=S5ZE14_9CREN|nr:DNA topoisomerase VI subunit B [Thermofilum adornatum]AGT35308.1 DNA topoisomerase VI subunit B [Thermofilum adornatum]